MHITTTIRRIPLIALLALPLMAQTVTDIPLDRMVRESETIFVGTVLETRGGIDENGDIATWTTFRVEQQIRGTLPGGTRTVKQFGGTAEGMNSTVEHMRYFTEGERLLVMFYPESRLGYTSPIGLSQGVWPVLDGGLITGLRPENLEGVDPALLARYDLADGAPPSYPLNRFVELLGEMR